MLVSKTIRLISTLDVMGNTVSGSKEALEASNRLAVLIEDQPSTPPHEKDSDLNFPLVSAITYDDTNTTYIDGFSPWSPGM